MSKPGIRNEIEDFEEQGISVGARAQRVAAEILLDGIEKDRVRRTVQVLSATRRDFASRPRTLKPYKVLSETASVAASYLERFALSDEWKFAGGGRSVVCEGAELVFEHRHAGYWLIDQIRTGRSRAYDAALRLPVEQALVAGETSWGAAFVGVRICTVSRPMEARLYPARQAQSICLSDTTLVPRP